MFACLRRRSRKPPPGFVFGTPQEIGRFLPRQELAVVKVTGDASFRGWMMCDIVGVSIINGWLLVPKNKLWVKTLNLWTRWFGWELSPHIEVEQFVGWKIVVSNPLVVLWDQVCRWLRIDRSVPIEK
jgi:hypothetical protein